MLFGSRQGLQHNRGKTMRPTRGLILFLLSVAFAQEDTTEGQRPNRYKKWRQKNPPKVCACPSWLFLRTKNWCLLKFFPQALRSFVRKLQAGCFTANKSHHHLAECFVRVWRHPDDTRDICSASRLSGHKTEPEINATTQTLLLSGLRIRSPPLEWDRRRMNWPALFTI